MMMMQTQWCSLITMTLLLLSQAADQADTLVFSSPRRVDVHGCNIYMAPSNLGGWGAYAGRDFEQGEVIEIAPRYIPMKNQYLSSNVLNDYHYQFNFQMNLTDTSFGSVAVGMTMFYNHGPGSKHNVQITGFGREPDKDLLWSSMLIGYIAKRPIRRGEELLSSYGTTDLWFTKRGYSLVLDDKDYLALSSRAEIIQREKQYCPKTVAGVGHSTWKNRIVATYQHYRIRLPFIKLDNLLPLQDHPTAVAKEAVTAGQILEMAPVLLMLKDHVESTPLAPMTMFWEDFDHEQQEALKRARELGLFNVKAVSNETGLMEHDVLKYYEELAILPAAGSIGLVRKVGHEQGADSNCRVEFVPTDESGSSMSVGSSGLIVKLIATKNIHAGEELRLNLPDSSSWHSKTNHVQQLALTGQPIPKHLLEVKDPRMISNSY